MESSGLLDPSSICACWLVPSVSSRTEVFQCTDSAEARDGMHFLGLECAPIRIGPFHQHSAWRACKPGGVGMKGGGRGPLRPSCRPWLVRSQEPLQPPLVGSH